MPKGGKTTALDKGLMEVSHSPITSSCKAIYEAYMPQGVQKSQIYGVYGPYTIYNIGITIRDYYINLYIYIYIYVYVYVAAVLCKAAQYYPSHSPSSQDKAN